MSLTRRSFSCSVHWLALCLCTLCIDCVCIHAWSFPLAGHLLYTCMACHLSLEWVREGDTPSLLMACTLECFVLLYVYVCRYSSGIIPTRKSLSLCEKVSVSAFCRSVSLSVNAQVCVCLSMCCVCLCVHSTEHMFALQLCVCVHACECVFQYTRNPFIPSHGLPSFADNTHECKTMSWTVFSMS